MFDAPNAQEVNSPASVANARGEGEMKRNRGVWFAGDEGKELTRRRVLSQIELHGAGI